VSGNEFKLGTDGYEAIITRRAAALRQLTYQGRNLIVPFAAGEPIPDYRGIIAAPWPNRIADGKYSFDGIDHELPVNEHARQTSLHGLAFDKDWTVKENDARSLTLTCTVGNSAGYPFVLELQAQYVLDQTGLQCAVTATNTGESAAPYGVCPHPYLVAGNSSLDEWVLNFQAASFLEVTPDRLLPIGAASVEGHPFDFRTPRAIGDIEIDHAFTGMSFDDGLARLSLLDPAGTGVGMSWDETCPWLQIHTADKPAPLPNRLGVAVEPMTCPPDAYNSGANLIRLEPAARHTAAWKIYSL
jgi:aldose 1-epimerase